MGCKSAMASSYLPCWESLRAAAKSVSELPACDGCVVEAGAFTVGDCACKRAHLATRKTTSHLAVDICAYPIKAIGKIRTQRNPDWLRLDQYFITGASATPTYLSAPP